MSIVIAQGSSASSTITTLILESDKPAYKPGQDINARALAIESETLNPVAGTVTFTFRDPQGFVARRITATADTYGVAEATMATSTEPTLGQWGEHRKRRDQREHSSLHAGEVRVAHVRRANRLNLRLRVPGARAG